jgi:hypothetical protein
VYIAQPPLFRIKKGKFEQYIKDERQYVDVMIKRASDGMVLTYGDQAAKLTGHDLTEYMTRLNDYLNLFEKVGKRLRNDQVTRDFVELFAHEGAAPAKKDDFLTPASRRWMKSTRRIRFRLPTRRAPSGRSTGRWRTRLKRGSCWASTRSLRLGPAATSCRRRFSSRTLRRRRHRLR